MYYLEAPEPKWEYSIKRIIEEVISLSEIFYLNFINFHYKN